VSLGKANPGKGEQHYPRKGSKKIVELTILCTSDAAIGAAHRMALYADLPTWALCSYSITPMAGMLNFFGTSKQKLYFLLNPTKICFPDQQFSYDFLKKQKQFSYNIAEPIFSPTLLFTKENKIS
jgi:hypothetical protein